MKVGHPAIMIGEHLQTKSKAKNCPILTAKCAGRMGRRCLLQLLEAGAVGDIFEEAGESGLAFFSE